MSFVIDGAIVRLGYVRLLRATVGFFISLSLSVVVDQIGSNWTDFSRNFRLGTFTKICQSCSI
jgi:hypothetical protein